MITTTDHVSPTSASVVRAGQSARKRSKSLIVQDADRGGVGVRAARWTTEWCSAFAVWEEREARLAAAPRRGPGLRRRSGAGPGDRAAHCRPVRGRLERPEGG